MPAEGTYTYKDEGDKSGPVGLVQQKWRDGKTHWVIMYNKGWRPSWAGAGQTQEVIGTGSDEETDAEIANGNLTLASGGRRRTRRTRRKSRARKSRRYRK